MTNTQTLYQGLLHLLDRGQWQDQRHLKTAVNMIVGLMLSSSISLTHWIPYTISRALRAQSVQWGFTRWLSNQPIQVRESTLYLALDTMLLWE